MISTSRRIIREYNKHMTKANIQLVSNMITRSQQSSNLSTNDKNIDEPSSSTTSLSPALPPYQTTSKSKLNREERERNLRIRQEKKEERERFLKAREESNARFKDYLASLPELSHPDNYTVECINNPDIANEKILQLTANEGIFGVDLEWPPNFVKGQPENKVSLVQICGSDKIILVQLARMPALPSELKRFFENRDVLKTGVNIGADGQKLYRDFGLLANGLVDVRDMVNATKSPKLALSHLRSLRALTGLFLDQNMYKGKVRMSNWGKAELSALQIKYAALDAYASYKLFVVLSELQQKKKPVPVKHLADNPPKQPQKQGTPLPQKKHYQNNKSTPTSTVTIIRKKQ